MPSQEHPEQSKEVVESSSPSREQSPPASPDLKTSRKRSLERPADASSPKAEPIDISEVDGQLEEIGTPNTPAAKRSKYTKLKGTRNGSDDDHSLDAETPPAGSTSPRHESKIRQISQGVEDIHMKKGSENDNESPQSIDVDAVENNDDEFEMIEKDGSDDDKAAAKKDAPESGFDSASPPSPSRSPQADEDGEEGRSPKAGAFEAETATEGQPADASRSTRSSRRSSRSDMSISSSKSGRSSVDSAMRSHKRIRDDPNGDESPRLKKKPTPPSSPHTANAVANSPKEETNDQNDVEIETPASPEASSDEKQGEVQSAISPRASPREKVKEVAAEAIPPASKEKIENTAAESPASSKDEQVESDEQRPDASPKASPKDTESEQPKEAPAPVAAPKLSGFMAYASASGFSTVQDQSVFKKSVAPSSSSTSPTRPSPLPQPDTKPALGDEKPAPETDKLKGFEVFASSKLAFASTSPPEEQRGRDSSPSRRSLNAFSSYASGGASPFSITPAKSSRPSTPATQEKESGGGDPLEPAVKGAEGVFGTYTAGANGSEEEEEEEPVPFMTRGRAGQGSTFGDKLRATRDEEQSTGHGNDFEARTKIDVSEQEVPTGEEEEETVYQRRVKMYRLEQGWREKGTGILKVNVRREDGSRPRFVMRKDTVYTVILNSPLFKGMEFKKNPHDDRYVLFSAIEEDGTIHSYMFRVGKGEKDTDSFVGAITPHIPTQ